MFIENNVAIENNVLNGTLYNVLIENYNVLNVAITIFSMEHCRQCSQWLAIENIVDIVLDNGTL